MTSFIKTINKARARDVSKSLWRYLYDSEFRENGASRPLTGTEIAVVQQVFSDYTVLGDLTVYGAEDVTALCERMSACFAEADPDAEQTHLLALAIMCIRALETRLCKEQDANELLMADRFH